MPSVHETGASAEESRPALIINLGSLAAKRGDVDVEQLIGDQLAAGNEILISDRRHKIVGLIQPVDVTELVRRQLERDPGLASRLEPYLARAREEADLGTLTPVDDIVDSPTDVEG